MRGLDDIWTGDLLSRRSEAERLIGFLKVMGNRPSLREDASGYVLAIDAPYGQGKSFFLARFAEHMAQSHPVAFVDAWRDDLSDEPLVALAATLDEALSPLANRSAELSRRLAVFKDKATKVAKIVSVGLAKRLLSLAIMSSGAEALHHVVHSSDETTKHLGEDVLKKSAEGIVDDVADATATIISGTMEERVVAFRRDQAAVREMKAALAAIVEHLGEDKLFPPPIVIVIDELDRCRPTYAIKLLEEVKHLFDVPGVIFVLGTHGEALAHSITAEYGPGFDGAAYLRRFFNKKYNLRRAQLLPLITWLAQRKALPLRNRLFFPRVKDPRPHSDGNDPAYVISLYMELYGFNVRDVFAVLDALETALALSQPSQLLGPLLLPLLLARQRDGASLPRPPHDPVWAFVVSDSFGRQQSEIDPVTLANQLVILAGMDNDALMTAVNRQDAGLAEQLIARYTFNGPVDDDNLDLPRNYTILIDAVDRFG